MAYRHRYVDPDSGAGSPDGTTWALAYTSLNQAEQAEDNTGDIRATGGSNEIVVFHCRASSGAEDTAQVQIDGWITDSGGYIVVVAEAIDTSYGSGSPETTGTGRHHGVWSTSHYRLETSNTDTIKIFEDYVRLDGLQLSKSSSNGNTQPIINDGGANASNALWISNCLCKQAGNASYTEPGIYLGDADRIAYIWNTIIYGLGGNTGSGNSAIYQNNTSTVSVFNCTLIGGSQGFRYATSATSVLKNCYAYGASGSAYTGGTLTTCASDDTSGTVGLQNIAYDTTEGAGHAGFTNVTAGSENYTLKSGSALVGVGTTLTDDPPGSTALGIDIIGTTRS